MNKFLFIILGFFVFLCSCGNSKKAIDSFLVFRHNFFDSTSFAMNQTDTNKFDIAVLEQVYQLIKGNKQPKCILVETVYDHIPLKEYNLYNIESGGHFEMTRHEKLMAFKVTTDSAKITLLDFINNNLLVLEKKATQGIVNKKHDIGYYIVNIIEIRNSDITINAYYLKELK